MPQTRSLLKIEHPGLNNPGIMMKFCVSNNSDNFTYEVTIHDLDTILAPYIRIEKKRSLSLMHASESFLQNTMQYGH